MNRQQLETLEGRYRLIEVIGRGGMSTVYRAVDARLRRTVAVKVLSPALAEADPVSLTRFEREARAAAALTHPGVVAVYDTGIEREMRFIVMEYVAGHSLAEVLREEGSLRPDRAVYIAEQVADALAAAHAAGIIHRDVKPGNVMIAEGGEVKVLDFGIARAIDATALTQNAAVVGTAAYLSPEQAMGEEADERSDIYSLGCLLYAMLIGSPPFTGEASPAVLHQHLHGDPPSPRALNDRVSPQLDALVLEMLAKPPEERPQTALEVRDRLAQVMSGAPVALAETAPTARVGEAAATRMMPGAPPRGRRGAAFLGAALAVAALVAAILAIASSGSTSSRSSTTGSPVTSSSRQAPSTTSAAPTTTSAPAAPAGPAARPKPNPPAKTTPSNPGNGGQPPGQAKKQGTSTAGH